MPNLSNPSLRKQSKMSKKRRVCERLDDDEALVVAPTEVLEYLVSVFYVLADREPQYRDGWVETAELFRYWIDKTSSRYEDDELDE